MTQPEKEVLTVDEVGQLLGISRQLAYKAVNGGDIPSFRIGKRILISRKALDNLINGVTHDTTTT